MLYLLGLYLLWLYLQWQAHLTISDKELKAAALRLPQLLLVEDYEAEVG